MEKRDAEKTVTVPDGVSVAKEGDFIVLRGPKGELKRILQHPKVSFEVSGNAVRIASKTDRRKEIAVVGTWAAHIKNMATGVVSGWEGRLKVMCSHFPVKVNVEGDRIVIQNFLGERKPRAAKIPEGVKVEVKKDEIIVSGLDKETVGNTCGNIELVTRVTGRDRRVFQDGIYIVGKPQPMEGEK
ncbi:MAG: 50S ribosomal protein L6 [Candidatus Aenigmatarchaeota archaeon]